MEDSYSHSPQVLPREIWWKDQSKCWYPGIPECFTPDHSTINIPTPPVESVSSHNCESVLLKQTNHTFNVRNCVPFTRWHTYTLNNNAIISIGRFTAAYEIPTQQVGGKPMTAATPRRFLQVYVTEIKDLSHYVDVCQFMCHDLGHCELGLLHFLDWST